MIIWFSLESKSWWWQRLERPGPRCSPSADARRLRRAGRRRPSGTRRWGWPSCSAALATRRRRKFHRGISASAGCCCCSTGPPEPRSAGSAGPAASPWAAINTGRAPGGRETVASARRIFPSGTRRSGWSNGRPPHLFNNFSKPKKSIGIRDTRSTLSLSFHLLCIAFNRQPLRLLEILSRKELYCITRREERYSWSLRLSKDIALPVYMPLVFNNSYIYTIQIVASIKFCAAGSLDGYHLSNFSSGLKNNIFLIGALYNLFKKRIFQTSPFLRPFFLNVLDGGP